MNDTAIPSPLVLYLKEYVQQWAHLAEFSQVFENPYETTLRIVREQRDVTIAFEHDCTVWICGSTRAHGEVAESWQTNLYREDRDSYNLQQFIEDPRSQINTNALASIRKLVYRNKVNKCKLYLELNNAVISEFVGFWLDGDWSVV